MLQPDIIHVPCFKPVALAGNITVSGLHAVTPISTEPLQEFNYKNKLNFKIRVYLGTLQCRSYNLSVQGVRQISQTNARLNLVSGLRFCCIELCHLDNKVTQLQVTKSEPYKNEK